MRLAPILLCVSAFAQTPPTSYPRWIAQAAPDASGCAPTAGYLMRDIGGHGYYIGWQNRRTGQAPSDRMTFDFTDDELGTALAEWSKGYNVTAMRIGGMVYIEATCRPTHPPNEGT